MYIKSSYVYLKYIAILLANYTPKKQKQKQKRTNNPQKQKLYTHIPKVFKWRKAQIYKVTQVIIILFMIQKHPQNLALWKWEIKLFSLGVNNLWEIFQVLYV